MDDLTGSEWEWTAGAVDVAHTTEGIIRGGGWRDHGLFLAMSNRGLGGIGFRTREYGLRVCADVP